MIQVDISQKRVNIVSCVLSVTPHVKNGFPKQEVIWQGRAETSWVVRWNGGGGADVAYGFEGGGVLWWSCGWSDEVEWESGVMRWSGRVR